MKALNLYAFTRIDTDYASEYMNMLSARDQKERCRPHEFLTVKKLVQLLLENDVPVEFLDGFFFSYSINQIGKEFDLLKIEQDRVVLNIELKSEDVGMEEIEKQLRQNRYYLGFVASDIRLFTFVESTGDFFELIGDTCYKVSVDALVDALPIFRDYLKQDIEKLFEPKQFLISPFTDPVKFLKGKYFLTQQQQDIREKIMETVGKENHTDKLFGITGGTGSGKTLLLYDIARSVAREGQSCCLFHTGELCEGHAYLSEHWEHVTIYPIRLLDAIRIKEYDFLFVDEAHRMYREDVDRLLKIVRETGAILVLSYDNEEWLSRTEQERDIPSYLASLNGFREWVLSKRIRTGIEIAAFYRNLLDLRNQPRGDMDYSNIDVIYGADTVEADALIHFYETQLNYMCPNQTDSRSLTGQEYENVLVIVNENFLYDEEGCIRDKIHPEADLELDHLMVQNVTRTRCKLCILVVGNYKLFQQIAGIKYQMLEKVQYKESIFELALSGKQLTRLTRAMKERANDLPWEDGMILVDTVDIIQEELMRPDSNRKILQNSVHFLERITRDNQDKEEFVRVAKDYIRYISNG